LITSSTYKDRKINVLITGASRGIGKACFDLFESKGASVIGPTRNELDLADETNFQKNLAYLGNFDVLILNAAVNEIRSIEELNEESLLKLLHINTLSSLRIIKHNLDYMKKQNWGRIVFLSSLFESRAKVGRTMYSMSKAANSALVRNLAIEFGEFNILTNSVAPGFVSTDLTKINNSPADIQEIERNIPMKRLAQPEEIAELCYLLGSPLNTYINGHSLVADGGYSCR
jgi:3-oxoacyl-[acyl-carrier protein] reductase